MINKYIRNCYITYSFVCMFIRISYKLHTLKEKSFETKYKMLGLKKKNKSFIYSKL